MNDPVFGPVMGFIGVLVGAAIVTIKESVRDSLAKKKAAEYLAIRIVTAMDSYVEGCATVASDDGLDMGQTDPQGYYRIQTTEPEFKVHLIDGDWKTLDTSLMYEILSFPNAIRAAEHCVSSLDAVPPYDDLIEERRFQYAALGLKAASLTDKVRKEYAIPERGYEGWNPVVHLQDMKALLEERRAKAAVAQARMHEQLRSSGAS